MIGALARAVGQLSDPRLQRVIGKTLIGSIITFVLTVAAAWLLLANTTLFSGGWLEDALDLLGDVGGLGIDPGLPLRREANASIPPRS